MYLYDILRVCLLALASRYPDHTIDFDEAVIDVQGMEAKGWSVEEIIGFLEAVNSHQLQAPASLLIDGSTCAIYLTSHYEGQPAFHIHCRGKIPLRRSHSMARWEKRQYLVSAVS